MNVYAFNLRNDTDLLDRSGLGKETKPSTLRRSERGKEVLIGPQNLVINGSSDDKIQDMLRNMR